jgi:hypothetical protein
VLFAVGAVFGGLFVWALVSLLRALDRCAAFYPGCGYEFDCWEQRCELNAGHGGQHLYVVRNPLGAYQFRSMDGGPRPSKGAL